LNIDVITTFNFQIAFLHTLGNLRTYRDQVATVSCGSTPAKAAALQQLRLIGNCTSAMV